MCRVPRRWHEHREIAAHQPAPRGLAGPQHVAPAGRGAAIGAPGECRASDGGVKLRGGPPARRRPAREGRPSTPRFRSAPKQRGEIAVARGGASGACARRARSTRSRMRAVPYPPRANQIAAIVGSAIAASRSAARAASSAGEVAVDASRTWRPRTGTKPARVERGEPGFQRFGPRGESGRDHADRDPRQRAPSRASKNPSPPDPATRGRRERASSKSSISRILSPFGVTVIPLGAGSPPPSSNLPGSLGRASLKRSPIWSCSAWGLPSRRRCRRRWCALTAPFHPYRPRLTPASRGGPRRGTRPAVCSLLHYPSRFRGLGVTQHAALWSSDFPPRHVGPRRSRTAATVRPAPTTSGL